MADRHEVCTVDQLEPGDRTIVEIEGLPHSVGVFNVDGEFHAIANVCPHQLAPLCEGTLTGEVVAENVGEFEQTRSGEIIRCPWHGWKFDIADGTSLFNPHAVRTRTYETGVEMPDAEACAYGTELAGDEPPIETYDTEIEDATVVVYV
ncbi:Rieske (2Fe-2S) protein [Salinadaptatus halalkaliphilus]|uniref:Rieske (2Fe-2S) protein n=1 Tax=Salinadaptatus halalkaliphilus TaxID=2419781 RepID=A0A4S3TQS8_9EURY|nr:Rieske (2Fe-2S) protein [Salinadaptatus halalkaliphilus]THE65990.1 Rieske (2Fe-2S) protein [Salinadaptatus halalkaliphilus]